MAGFRNSQKLVAGIGEVLYTVPAGKSATVSVQALGASGFILAAQQSAISVNPLIPIFSTNNANVSVIAQGGGLASGTYYTNTGQANAFNTSSGNFTATGMNVITLGANGLTTAPVATAIASEIHLDYRVALTTRFLAYDSYLGGYRGIVFNPSTYPLPALYTRSTFSGSASATPPSYTQGTGCSTTFTYFNMGAAQDASFVFGLDSSGYISVSTSYNSSGSSAITDITTTDAASNTNNLPVLKNANTYTFGNNTFSIVYNASGNLGLFVGGWKTGAAPAIFTIRVSGSAWNAAQNWARFYLTGPANGTCPLWVRYFGVNYYIGMSDGTLWKVPASPTDIFPSGTASSTIAVTQVTLPAGISIDRRPVVVSATAMHFGKSGAINFPFVMSTSDVFTEIPNAIYPAELSFASATIPNPKLILKYGTTVNEYTVVDATNVYKTVANYSALDADSFLFNGFTGSFERTGIVMAAGDILYAAQPADSNCVVQVYGYEED
jgi:hypothetical protein